MQESVSAGGHAHLLLGLLGVLCPQACAGVTLVSALILTGSSLVQTASAHSTPGPALSPAPSPHLSRPHLALVTSTKTPF